MTDDDTDVAFFQVALMSNDRAPTASTASTTVSGEPRISRPPVLLQKNCDLESTTDAVLLSAEHTKMIPRDIGECSSIEAMNSVQKGGW